MKIESKLDVFGAEHTISCKINFRPSSESYQLNPDSFYLEFGKKKPVGKGYEIEILNYPEILDWHKKQKVFTKNGKLLDLHVHKGDDTKMYVCYPLQIKTKEESIRLHKEWSRVMFAQIFFCLTDEFLYLETVSSSTTEWCEYIDEFLKTKNLKIEDSI